MLVQVNTDNRVKDDEQLTRTVVARVEAALDRFGDRLTRVEVLLCGQKNSCSPSGDERCLVEARLAGLQPIAVRHRGTTMDQAIDGAVERLQRLLADTVSQLDGHRGAMPTNGRETA